MEQLKRSCPVCPQFPHLAKEPFNEVICEPYPELDEAEPGPPTPPAPESVESERDLAFNFSAAATAIVALLACSSALLACERCRVSCCCCCCCCSNNAAACSCWCCNWKCRGADKLRVRTNKIPSISTIIRFSPAAAAAAAHIVPANLLVELAMAPASAFRTACRIAWTKGC